MENSILKKYQLSKKEKAMLWLTNYEFGESLMDITDWVKFQSLDEFANKLVMSKKCESNEYFLFC